MSYKVEFFSDSRLDWTSTTVRFLTREEAEGYMTDLATWWKLPLGCFQVTKCNDPVNYGPPMEGEIEEGSEE